MAIGCEVFLAFAVDVGAITEDRRQKLLQKVEQDLKDLMRSQDEEQAGENVVEIFLEALGNALASGRIYAEDWYTREEPTGIEEACGWRLKRHFADPQDGQEGKEEVESWRAQGDRIGWIRDGKQLLLIADTAYGQVERLLNRPIGVSKRTLIRRLAEADAIAEHDPGVNVKLVSNEGRKQKMLVLKAERVLGDEDTQSRSEDDNMPF